MMKKKLLTAAILAAMTISTASAFAAAPSFSGDANLEYDVLSNQNSIVTNRIRLNLDNQIDNNIYLHGRMVMNNSIYPTGNSTDDNNVKLEQAYIGFKFDNADIKAGRQPLFLGHGLMADANGIGALKLNTTMENVDITAFHGRDGGANVTAAEVGTVIGNTKLGASYMKKTDGYLGFNASTKLTDKAVLNLEWVKNNDSKADGYWAEVKVGNAVKKGEFDYSLGYVKLEDSAVDGGYVTDGNMADSKGMRVKAHYAVSDNSTLTFYHDNFDKDSDSTVKKNRTNLEYEVRF